MWGRRASTSLAWRSMRAFSRLAAVSVQVSYGSYFPGMTGIKSRIWRPKTISAGERLSSGVGVFLYVSMARWNAGMSASPCGPVFSMIKRLADLTPISARVLEWG